MTLHKSHQAVLDYIRTFLDERNMSPTVREIENAVGKSRGSIQNSLKRLQKDGYIAWNRNKSRTIRILKLNELSDTFLDAIAPKAKGIPVKGEIAAGYCHDPATDAVVDFLDIDYAGRKDTDYVLKISGDSMVGVGIPDGAYVGIRPVEPDYKPRPGEVVAVWVQGFGSTLKHFFQKESVVVLESANPKYEPMIFDLNTIEITVKGIHLFTHWQTARLAR